MKLAKSKNKMINNYLWNYFTPLHEHIGFEKGVTSEQITNFLIKKCDINIKNKYELKFFHYAIIDRIWYKLMKPKSKMYIKGLQCGSIGNIKTSGRIGYYYIAKTKEEIDRVKKLTKKEIDNRQNNLAIRVMEATDMVKQLGFDTKEDTKLLSDK